MGFRVKWINTAESAWNCYSIRKHANDNPTILTTETVYDDRKSDSQFKHGGCCICVRNVFDFEKQWTLSFEVNFYSKSELENQLAREYVSFAPAEYICSTHISYRKIVFSERVQEDFTWHLPSSFIRLPICTYINCISIVVPIHWQLFLSAMHIHNRCSDQFYIASFLFIDIMMPFSLWINHGIIISMWSRSRFHNMFWC